MKMLKAQRSLLSILFLAFSLVALNACNDDDPKPSAPAAPTLSVASEITATGFKATWTEVTGAEKYLLDVSLQENFSATVTGYAKKEITGATTHTVAGLTTATKYYFRVYAKKGTLTSVASATKDATTL